MIAFIKKILQEKNMSSLVSNLSISMAGLLSFLLLTRQLPKSLFGDWVLFITLATFVDLLRFGLTRTAAVRQLSGSSQQGKASILASSFKIHLFLMGFITIVCWMSFWVLGELEIAIGNGYRLFFLWYPLLALSNLSWNNAMALFQAEQRFVLMMKVRLANVGLFLLFLIGNHWYFGFGLSIIIMVNIIVNALSSTWCMLRKWDGLYYLKRSSKATERQLIQYGKYSMGTLISSSLLKSADTLIIGLSPMLGSVGIAMYAIPLKLTDLVSIPLNSFAMTAFPQMSKKSMNGDVIGARRIFYIYSGSVTLLFLPVTLIAFIFADHLVLFLGGTEYIENLSLLTAIFRVFTVYLLLLPMDRFTGVLLNSLDKPQYNFYKTVFMIVMNVLVDIIAVFLLESLVFVAIGTVAFTFLGVVLGYFFVKREVEINVKGVFDESIQFLKGLKLKLVG